MRVISRNRRGPWPKATEEKETESPLNAAPHTHWFPKGPKSWRGSLENHDFRDTKPLVPASFLFVLRY